VGAISPSKHGRRSGFPAGAFTAAKEKDMGGDEKDLPSGDESIEKEAEESRRELNEVPEPGTDPLHEGP
jgi:hypothetical protein